jgi:hypothetical protein
VIRVPGYKSRGPGFDSRRYQIFWVWNVVHSASWVQLRSYLEEKEATLVQKTEITIVGICRADQATPLPIKIGINFAGKRRSV